jgi:hypothetical protein
MRKKNGAGNCDPKVVRQKYEMLRANALGNMNLAAEFTVFLRNGMSAWVRAIGDQDRAQRKIRQETSTVFTELNVDMPGAALASILTDAILNAAGTARH